MNILLVKENSREDDLNFSIEYPLLNKNFVETCKAHALYAEGKLRTDALIKEVQNFDTTYMFSDNGRAYSSWSKIHEELLAKIKESTAFTESERDALIDGLNYQSNGKFLRAFPYARIIWTCDEPPAEVVAFNNGEYDESRIIEIQNIINGLSDCWGGNNIPELTRDNIVYTKAAPNPRLITNKVSLCPDGHKSVMAFESSIRKSDLDYLMMWNSSLEFWGTSFHGGDCISKRMTKLNCDVICCRTNPILLTNNTKVRGYTFYHSDKEKRGGITLVLN